MHEITASGLRFSAFHGCLPEERREAQPFIVNARLFLDLAPAIAADDLSLTVDYSQVYAIIAAIMNGPPLNLLESLAGRIAQSLLQAFPPLTAVEVEVRKPSAPVDGEFDYFSACVKLTRSEV